MKNKYTIADYIILYIKSKLQHNNPFILRNSHLQLFLPNWIKNNFPKHYKGVAPETIARTWRRIREYKLLDKEDIVCTKIADMSKVEDVYKIERKITKGENLTLF